MKKLPRPPVVVVLGHVDHGKTSLLDYIKKTKLAEKEHGGITQKIGAYEIITKIKGYKNNKITFIDTPGHEAFSELRARGANIADVAILVIDASDSVMPQTVESISHIKAAKIPYVVALNKMDLPGADPEKVKTDLMKHEVHTEKKGGDVPVVNISAKKGTGAEELLETILLISEGLDLKFNPEDPPKAYIIETKKDRRGTVVSAIIKNGQLKVGDTVFAKNIKAKIRSMINDLGQPITQAFPSTPFEILGFSQLPDLGSLISTEAVAGVQKEQPESQQEYNKPISLDSLLHPVKEEKKLSVVIKADSQGSLDSVCSSLSAKENVEVILRAVGDIHRSDVFLAKSTGAIILGFGVNVPSEVGGLAKQEKVIIKTYRIIYELLDELNEVADLLKEKEEKEKNLKGELKVLASFTIEGEKVFGVKITKGKINLGDELQIFRNNNPVGKTKLVSLKIRAKKVEEVKKEQEAGMVFSPQLDIRIGDMVKSVL